MTLGIYNLMAYPFRSVTLDYAEDVENSGISSYRFVGTEQVFANTTDNADNWCFCSGGTCNPSGISNSSTCRFGAPVFVSFPHFYLADPYFLSQVDGLDPQKDLHQFRIDLEPVRLSSVLLLVSLHFLFLNGIIYNLF